MMGRDVVEAVRYFSERKQIFKVHYRNVDKPLPHFVETFIDDGYMDLYQVTKALEDGGRAIEGRLPVGSQDSEMLHRPVRGDKLTDDGRIPFKGCIDESGASILVLWGAEGVRRE